MREGPPQSSSFFLLTTITAIINTSSQRLRSDPLRQDYITQINLASHINTSQNPQLITPNTLTILSSSSSSSSPAPPISNRTAKMPSSNTTSKTSQTTKTYEPSVASTSSSASYIKPSKSTESSSKRRTSILNGAKRLLADLGSPPTAAYDRQQAAKGERTDSQKVYYMPNQTPSRI